MPEKRKFHNRENPDIKERRRERLRKFYAEGRMGPGSNEFPRPWQSVKMKELAEYALLRGQLEFNGWEFFCLARELAIAESAVEKSNKNFQQIVAYDERSGWLRKVLQLSESYFNERAAHLEKEGKFPSVKPEYLEISPLMKSVETLSRTLQVRMDSESYPAEELQTFIRDCINATVPLPGVLLRAVHNYQNFWYDMLILAPWKTTTIQRVLLELRSVLEVFPKPRNLFGTHIERPVQVPNV